MDTSDNVGTVDFQHDFSDKLKLRSVVRYGHEIADYIATQPQFERADLLAGVVRRPGYGLSLIHI